MVVFGQSSSSTNPNANRETRPDFSANSFCHGQFIFRNGCMHRTEISSFHLDCILTKVPLHGCMDHGESRRGEPHGGMWISFFGDLDGGLHSWAIYSGKTHVLRMRPCKKWYDLNYSRPSKRSSMAFFLRLFFFVVSSLVLSVLVDAERSTGSDLWYVRCVKTVFSVRWMTSPTSSLPDIALGELALTNLFWDDWVFISLSIPVALVRRDKAHTNTVPSAENCVSATIVEKALTTLAWTNKTGKIKLLR